MRRGFLIQWAERALSPLSEAVADRSSKRCFLRCAETIGWRTRHQQKLQFQEMNHRRALTSTTPFLCNYLKQTVDAAAKWWPHLICSAIMPVCIVQTGASGQGISSLCIGNTRYV